MATKPIRTVADYRDYLGDTANGYSDEDLLAAMAAGTGTPIHEAAEKFGYDTDTGPWHERASASIDHYQSNLYGLGEAVAGSVGAKDTEQFMARRRRANDISAGISSIRAKQGGIPDDWRDVTGPSSAAAFVGGIALDSAPGMAEMALGGGAGRLARVAAGGLRTGRAVAGSLEAADAARGANLASGVGGVVASYPSSVADILDNQREQNDKTGNVGTNLGAAALGGIPYAVLNAGTGAEKYVSRGQLPRSGIKALDSLGENSGVAGRIGGRLARAGVTGLGVAAEEGAQEVGQEFANQIAGRMAVDPNETFWNDESKKRYLDNFIGGAALGGVFGVVGSAGRRSEHYVPTSPMETSLGPDKFANLNTPSTDLLAPPPAGPGAAPSMPAGLTLAPPTAYQSPTVDHGDVAQDLLDVAAATGHPLTLAPNVAPIGPRDVAPTPFDTGNLALTPQDQVHGQAQTAAPGIGMPEAPIPVPTDGKTTDKPADQTPVQSSGTPEAIARLQQTEQNKVAANDAISRAQAAGMTSEKQQSLFWRQEELVKEGKLKPEQGTQVTALLMQSKFGVAKKMLDDAATGAPHADLLAKYKVIDKAVADHDKASTDADGAITEVQKLTDESPPKFDGKPEQQASKSKAWERKQAVAIAKAKVKAEAAKVKAKVAFDHVMALKGEAAVDPKAQATAVDHPAVADVAPAARDTAAIDRQLAPLLTERGTLYNAKGNRFPYNHPKGVRFNELTKQITALREEKDQIAARATAAATVAPAPAAAPVKVTVAGKSGAAASTAIKQQAKTTAATVKASTDKASKIKRLEAFLACIARK